MNDVESSIAVLREISNFLRRLSDEEVRQLAAGEARIVLDSKKTRPSTRSKERGSVNIARTIEVLGTKATREEGLSYLEQLHLTRMNLRRLADAMDLPVPKSDTVDRLTDRIIEATIGYRLRSAAIRDRGAERG